MLLGTAKQAVSSVGGCHAAGTLAPLSRVPAVQLGLGEGDGERLVALDGFLPVLAIEIGRDEVPHVAQGFGLLAGGSVFSGLTHDEFSRVHGIDCRLVDTHASYAVLSACTGGKAGGVAA